MSTTILHSGCFSCGSEKDLILKSKCMTIIEKGGKSKTLGRSVALCSVCFPQDVIDMRVTKG